MTYISNRIDTLSRRLAARTQRDGTPKPGYRENVAAIKAELEQLALHPSMLKETDNGEG